MKNSLCKATLLGLSLAACGEPTATGRTIARPVPRAATTIVLQGVPGALYTWGQNSNYSLGLGDLKNRSTPTLVGTSSTWTIVAEATETGIAIQSDGTLWGWGQNASGQVGVGDQVNKPRPVKVGTQTDWVQVATGRLHTIALKADGTIWTWGEGQNGSLGLGDTNDRLIPTKVGTQNDWATVSAGYTRSFVIKTNGSLWGFGGNSAGSLGTGVGSGRYETPFQIGTSTLWAQVSTSNVANHSAGIQTDGSLWTWGTGVSGQLGLGNTQDKYVPTRVGSLNDWAYVECGWNFVVAIKTDGTLWAWGANGSGQLGIGSTQGKLSPVQVGNASNWFKVSAGMSHTLAIKADGTLWAWGDNTNGQLGVPGGKRVYRTTPAQLGTASDWKSVRATGGFGDGTVGSSTAIR
jgi:alpha-tubulin suppressor-like RCC1 family protein